MTLFITLSIVGIFRTLILITIIYYVVKLFTRYLLPNIVESKIKKIQHEMNEQHKQRERSGKKEGEVTIEYSKKQNGSDEKLKGEYIDFEEVE